MPQKANIRAEANALRARFEALGAEPVEADILQPAETLLDLYGEDIRARAFVTADPLRGEAMLRPDFTVPLVQRHMAEGRHKGRYTYAGEVFRKQEDHPDRPTEYMQVGYELFNGSDAADADADVFATFANILAPLGLRASMGDIALLRAAISGLRTTDARKAALLHHLWRPRRFRTLLDRFAAPSDAEPMQIAVDSSLAEIGVRTRAEVEARLQAVRDDRAAPPISTVETDLLDALLGISEKAPFALRNLAYLATDMPAISGAVDALKTRFDAMSKRGIDVDAQDFEASYGRTTLEYYDGFVFGFYADPALDMPPIATGGRYDALTRALGGGERVPAVGGVIRPGLTVALGGVA